jgi:hypothetical protein
MSISLILGAAQIGMSLFAARQQAQAALQTAELEAQRQGLVMGRAVFGGELERFQISNASRDAETFRRSQLGQAVGAQRASMAAAGIVGGRTQQLLRAKSQAAFTREQSRADSQERLQLTASRYRQSIAIEDAQMATRQAFSGAQQAARQATASFLGGALQTGVQLFGQE